MNVGKPQINFRHAKPNNYIALRWPELAFEVSFARAVGGRATFLQIMSKCCRAFSSRLEDIGWVCRECREPLSTVENPWVTLNRDVNGWYVDNDEDLLLIVRRLKLTVLDEVLVLETIRRQLSLFMSILDENSAFLSTTTDNSEQLQVTAKQFKRVLHG